MGEAKRRSVLGLPPRAAKFEEGVSNILDGQVPLQCGECREELIPEVMLFIGRCRCGCMVGSTHSKKSFIDDRIFCGGVVTVLLGIVEKLLGPERSHEN
jgi:hypothetical protein